MALDLLQYGKMVERAMRAVVRDALTQVNAHGLPGQHHFFITFKTGFPGVRMSGSLRARFPDDMTIVLQHQYWDLAVREESFDVTLSFSGVHEPLTIPFDAVTGFVDPSVKFGLQFEPDAEAAQKRREAATKAPPAAAKPAEASDRVVALDAFRKT
jgi:hypothetical protein